MIDPKIEITNLITPLINTYTVINSEWRHLFKIGIKEYLQSQTEKYYFTNTFLHRIEKVRFHDIYYPIKATHGSSVTTDFLDLNGVLENYGCITIIGSAGSGKTTLMKHFFLYSVIAKEKIPLLIELRNLNEYKGDFEALINDRILKSKVKPSGGTLKRALESGIFLFLLDGYDEIFSSKKHEINCEIQNFVDSYPKNHFIITTRPGSGIEGLSRFHDFNVSELSDEDVQKFIRQLVEDSERRSRILKIIKDPSNANYVDYLRNPLLLSMFIMAFENHPEIPSRKSAFYRNVFDTLYSKHDGVTKNSFPREKVTKLQREEFEKILSIFSYLTLIDGKYAFTEEYLTDVLEKIRNNMKSVYKIEDLIYDLRTTISILLRDGFEYSFPHRSMQEYFAAQFISDLPSDRKQIAYSNLFKTLKKSSSDYSLNLWTICNELDKVAFTTYFLIPELKKIVKILSVKSELELITTYFKLFHATFYQQKPETKLLIARFVNFNMSLFKFTKSYNHLPFNLFLETTGCSSELMSLATEKEKRERGFIHSLLKNPDAIEILKSNGFCELIGDFKTQIRDRISDYEIEVTEVESNLDELLKV